MSPTNSVPNGPFELPPLPFAEDALEPYISARTLSIHYGKHHAGYLQQLNKLVAGNQVYAGMSLADVISASLRKGDTKIYQNAAQTWNHTFYWHSLKASGGGEPTGKLAERIQADFGSIDSMRQQLAEIANSQFGTGWAWLVLEDGKLRARHTGDADTPITTGGRPLLTIDVWEHAYYLDYQNRKFDYVEAVIEHLLNWDFARDNFGK